MKILVVSDLDISGYFKIEALYYFFKIFRFLNTFKVFYVANWRGGGEDRVRIKSIY